MSSQAKVRALILLGLTLLSLLPVLASADVKGRVRISWNEDTEAWVGQQRGVNLELMTTGFSFSGAQFSLPEVTGAIFLQADSTTLKLSETRNGETWQILRYPLMLFPQKPGALTVPPIQVEFQSGAAFGTEPRAFDLRTESLTLQVLQPPDTQPGERVVSTRRYQMSHEWSRQANSMVVGDALQLSVTQSAANISGMLLPAPPIHQAEGLSTYPDAPRIEDRVDRGTLTGVRTDQVTWVFEQEGLYEFPELRFKWWDPANRELKAGSVPALSVTIEANPSLATPASGTVVESQLSLTLRLMLGIIMICLLGALAWWRLGTNRGSTSREKATPSERDCFRALQKACRQNDPIQAYARLGSWLSMIEPVKGATSATDFAIEIDDRELTVSIQALQYALIKPGNRDWTGAELAKYLRQLRRQLSKGSSSQPGDGLPALNPR